MIFDELPSHSFDKYYSESSAIYINSYLLNRRPPKLPLEVKCIKKYKLKYNIEILPVDIDMRQNLSKYQEEISFMIDTFFKDEDYKKLENEKETLIPQDGFNYLNSDRFLDYLEEKEIMEGNIMDSDIQKNRLPDIYKLFHAEHYDNRENTMLGNIYNYSKGKRYNQAVFLIGAGHKKSITGLAFANHATNMPVQDEADTQQPSSKNFNQYALPTAAATNHCPLAQQT